MDSNHPNPPPRGRSRSAIAVRRSAIAVLFASGTFLAASAMAAVYYDKPAAPPAVGGRSAPEPVSLPAAVAEPPAETPRVPPDGRRYEDVPQNVKDLAGRLGLNAAGKKIFYGSNPRIFDDDDPDYGCRGPEDAVVYGCWQAGSIAILRTPSMETTAAHEFLHAVYHDHHSRQQTDELDRLLDGFRRDNPETVAEFLEIYEGHYQYDNESSRLWAERSEIHSFVGSQVPPIPAALEEQYARVVGFYENWRDSFDRKRDEAGNVDRLVQDQDSQRRACLLDFRPADDCRRFEADVNAYQAYADCLASHLTGFDDCLALKPAFAPYVPATARPDF